MKKLNSTTPLLFVSSFISIIFKSCIECDPFDSIEYEMDKITVQPYRILNYWENESKNFDLLLVAFGLENIKPILVLN